MFRTRLLSAGIAIAAMALTATAQPAFESPPPGALILNLIDYVGDKNLAAELKLTDEQVKKLTDHRQKGWDAAYTTAPADFAKTQGARNKADEALLKEVLTPEQHTRATQLMAQDLLRSYRGGFGGGFGGPGGRAAPPVNVVRVSASTLRMYPEIADAAKLTAEQKKAVEASGKGRFGPGGGFAPPGGGFGGPGGGGGRFGGPFGYTEPRVVLAPDQSEALKKFLGPITPQSFRRFFDDRGQLGYGGGGPGLNPENALDTLVYRPVQTELKLTEEQIRVVSDIQQKNETFYREEANNLSTEKAVAREKELTAEIEKEFGKLLNKEQAARLKQLHLWMQIGPTTDIVARYQSQPIAEAIGLSDAQKKALTEANTAYREETLKAFEADEAIEVLKKKLAAAAETRAAAVEKVITADQKSKLKDLLGADFRDPRLGGGGGLGGTDITEVLKRLRTANFGRYSGELSTLTMQAVKDDLKITEEQGKKLQEAVAAYQEKYGRGGFPGNQTQEEADKAATERHAFVEKALADILTADQRKRFRELMIQYREQLLAGGFGGIGNTSTTVSVPGVAEEIKLSADQKKKILDGTEPAEVLTGDQTTALKKLAGEPMKGEFNLPFRGGNPRLQASTRLSLLDAAAIYPELKLTAEQEYKIALALEAYATTIRELNSRPVGKGDRDAAAKARKAQEEALAACEKAIDAVLTAEQKTRLSQLEVQSASGSLTTAFGLPSVAAKLALTADQKTKLDAIRADYRERSQLISSLSPRGFGGFVGGPGGAATASPMTVVREKARERMLAVLTDAQKSAWKELTGEPSKVPLVTGPGGGFGGGPRGIDP